MSCKHCYFLNKTFKNWSTNYEYWLYTEMFVYLHDGRDYCESAKIKPNNKDFIGKERLSSNE